ncbi:hypothetical protein B7463_g5895, partial [Scytalidium lignicola]
MAGGLQTKACTACAAAKRKCEKQKPCCMRCKKRGIECKYPSSKPSNFVLCEGDDPSPAVMDNLPYGAQLCAYSPGIQPRGADNVRLTPRLSPGFSNALINNTLPATWFTSQETWEVHPLPLTLYKSCSFADMNRPIIKIHQWLTQWIQEGSNPFIHSRLYQIRFPKSVQDAYTTLLSYFHRTPSNEKIIFQIIEDRVKQLVAEQGVRPGDSPEDIAANTVTTDPLEHVARVQALLSYQVVCLCNGDIRLRHLAETYIPVLDIWQQQMIKHASQAFCLGSFMISSTHEPAILGLNLSDLEHGSNLVWYSWILAESIRRTWLIASGIQAIYLAIQRGGAVPCKGGMMLTTRQGVWEARSAPAWEKICLEVNVGLMQMAEADRLFTEFTPEDVNDFTKVLFEAAFGVDRIERWGVRI